MESPPHEPSADDRTQISWYMEFRLLVEDPEPSSRRSITVEGRRWSLTDPLNIYTDDIPPYTCISYVWGSGRAENPIHPTSVTSDVTVPGLASVIRNHDSRALWVDAFCIPIDPVLKRPTLESMGYIYSRAAQVIVVLSKKAFDAVDRISRLGTSEVSQALDDCLDDLDADPWIRSVWTYQEVINSRNLFIVGREQTGMIIDGEHFLNCLGGYLTTYRKVNNLTNFEMTERYPYVETYLDLVADWFMAGFNELSAFQVMCGMDRRVSESPSNHFYSMLGSITKDPSSRGSKPTIEALSDMFMTICEEKGDYSFIYSRVERDKRPGYRWRPAPEMLNSVLSWYSFGSGQKAEKVQNGIIIKEMMHIEPASNLGPRARQEIIAWLGRPEMEQEDDSTLADRLYRDFKRVGFTGSQEYFMAEDGLFFPQFPVPPNAKVDVWVSTGVRWYRGAPGMVVVSTPGRQLPEYWPGVFAGATQTSGTDLLIEDTVDE